MAGVFCGGLSRAARDVVVLRRSIAVMLLLLAVGQLGFRGKQRLRTDMPMWDFASVYSAARTWAHGGDPYDVQRVVETWRHAGAYADRSVATWALVYPPNSLFMIVPLGLLPAGPALLAWLAITVVLLAWQFAALVELARLRWRDSRTLLLIGAALAAAPLQFGILSGQLSLPAISLCIIGFCMAARGRGQLAGALLGLACAIKPQVAGPFVVYYLVLRRWNVAKVAMLVAVAIGGMSLVAMQITHPNWVSQWMSSVAASSQVGGVNDYSWSGPFRDEIVDLKLLLVSIRHDPLVLRIVVECIVVALLVWFVRVFPRSDGRRGSERNELLALAGLSAISLMPLYHRVYDAALLTTALAWALAELDGPRRRWALATLVPMTLFLIPFDFVRSIGYRLPGITELAATSWWQSWIAPHYAWGLLGVTIALLLTMTRQTVAQPLVQPVVQPAVQPAAAGAAVLAADSDDDEEMMLAH
jgi:hypothetical protein